MATELLTNGVDAAWCRFDIADGQGRALLTLEFSELFEGSASRPAPDRPTVRFAATLEETHRRASTAKDGIAASLRQVRASLDESYALVERMRRWEGRPVNSR